MSDDATNKISISTDSSFPLKKCWGVGKTIVVAIDKEILKRLGINEDSTYVQQEVTDDWNLLRVKRYVEEERI